MRAAAVVSTMLLLLLPIASACTSAIGAGTVVVEDGPQGPLSGTYSADAVGGSAPFTSITFVDASHFSYIARGCVETARAIAGLGDMGEDNLGEITDDDPCTHEGTYVLTSTVLKLTEDGADESVDVPIDGAASDDIPADQTGTADTSNASADAGSGIANADVDSGAGSAASGTSNTSSFSIGGDIHIASLVGAGGSLFGSSSVTAFRASGSTFRRTGLAIGAANEATADLLTNSAVATAMQWVDAKMPYCWATNHAAETDSACFKVHGRTCDRTGKADNPSWNAYRSDCAGLVSFAWGLRAPGLTAYAGQFTPGPATYIPTQDLQPGDALLRPNHHIVLFEKWTNKEEGVATVIAEPGCSSKGGPFAQEQRWSLGGPPGKTPAASWLKEGTFYAIRKRGSSLTHH